MDSELGPMIARPDPLRIEGMGAAPIAPVRDFVLEIPPKILIVDDDSGMRFLLEETLQKDGYSCESVSDGRMALQRLEEERFPIDPSDTESLSICA